MGPGTWVFNRELAGYKTLAMSMGKSARILSKGGRAGGSLVPPQPRAAWQFEHISLNLLLGCRSSSFISMCA